jgi:hypothetical protein
LTHKREDDALFRRTSLAQATISSAQLVPRCPCHTNPKRRAEGRPNRFWGKIVPDGETQPRVLRVITLEDGETVHNAFFDRGFREEDE